MGMILVEIISGIPLKMNHKYKVKTAENRTFEGDFSKNVVLTPRKKNEEIKKLGSPRTYNDIVRNQHRTKKDQEAVQKPAKNRIFENIIKNKSNVGK